MTRLALVLAALMLAALAAPVPARAAKVDTFSFEEGDEDDFRPDVYAVGVVRFRGLPRERNRVTARMFDDRVLITDAGAPLSVGKGCRRRTRFSALCVPANSDQDVYRFSLTSGDDRFTWAGINRPAADLEVDGGPGDDRLAGSSSSDVLEGGAGDDRLDGRAGIDHLLGGQGDDRMLGGKGLDDLDGGTGADRMLGGAGNDTLRADDGARRVGNDRLDGGTGSHDVVSYSRRRSGVTASLAARRGGGAGERDTYRGVEWITGTPADDVLTGDDGRNTIEALGGNDRVDARGGDDSVDQTSAPVRGLDVTCGAGADRVGSARWTTLLRPDCETLASVVTSPQPRSVTADAVVLDLPCASGSFVSDRAVRVSLPNAGPAWAAPGPYATVLATGTRPEGASGARCPTTLTFTPAGKAAIGGRRSLPVTFSGYFEWSFVLNLP